MEMLKWKEVLMILKQITSCYGMDVYADKGSRMYSDQYKVSLCAQTNVFQLIGWRFTMQMDNDPKHLKSNPNHSHKQFPGLVCLAGHQLA